VYGSGSDFVFRRGEFARSSYKLSQVLKQLGLIDNSRKHLEIAEKLRHNLGSFGSSVDVNEAIYNSLVSLWSY
jgi:hypothetical protein